MSNDITWSDLGGDAYNLATRACLEAMSFFILIPWFLFPTKTFTSTVKGMWKMLFSTKTVCAGAVSTLIAYARTAATSVMDGTKMVLTNPVIGTVVRDTLFQNTTKVHTEVHNSTNTDDAETNKATEDWATDISNWIDKQILRAVEDMATVISNWIDKIIPGLGKVVRPVIVWIFSGGVAKSVYKYFKPKQQAVTAPPQQVETKQVKQEKKTTRRGRAKSPRR
jgi:uncharacterized protein (DUF697 family)